jgi:hypothetical protein
MLPIARALPIACGLALLGVVASATAGRAAEAEPRRLTVTGTGEVTAQPDMATVSLGVETQAESAAAALAQNSEAMAKVLARLEAAGIAAKDVQTSALSIYPVHEPNPDGMPRPKVIGYQAANQVTVQVRALDRLGAVLDQVVVDGANSMNGLSFAVAEPEPLLRQARDKAVADAMDKARRYAAAAGVALGPILALDEAGSAPPAPYMRRMAAEAMAADVPVAAGETTLAASVTVVFAIE